jgi:hypothetical protein
VGAGLALRATLERHRGDVTAARYSPDGSMLATCDANRAGEVLRRTTTTPTTLDRRTESARLYEHSP